MYDMSGKCCSICNKRFVILYDNRTNDISYTIFIGENGRNYCGSCTELITEYSMKDANYSERFIGNKATGNKITKAKMQLDYWSHTEYQCLYDFQNW